MHRTLAHRAVYLMCSMQLALRAAVSIYCDWPIGRSWVMHQPDPQGGEVIT